MSGKRTQEEAKDTDCKCYSSQRSKKTCPPVRNVTHPLRYYEFTREEIKALEECDKESFYQRCLPLSTLFAASTYAAIKYGLTSRSGHWGATPKVAAALLAGHVVGRLSYVPRCERKLRHLPPSSYLGQVMRAHRQRHSDN